MEFAYLIMGCVGVIVGILIEFFIGHFGLTWRINKLEQGQIALSNKMYSDKGNEAIRNKKQAANTLISQGLGVLMNPAMSKEEKQSKIGALAIENMDGIGELAKNFK